MITNIKMRNCATYDNTGIELAECSKINFIYGPNGSGKSTISNYLNTPNDLKYSDCEVKFNTLSSPEILVYNRDFREKNFSTNPSNIAGIFTLGESTIEEIKALEQLKEQLAHKQNELTGLAKTCDTKENELLKHQETFRDNVWESIYKKYSEHFKEAFQGLHKNKERFKEAVLQRYTSLVLPASTLDELQSRAQTLYHQKPESYPIPAFDFSHCKHVFSSIENNTIWSKIIFGNKDISISKLIETLNNSDWVNKGRNYLSDNNICPFCQQKTITEDFKIQLSRFFSGEYENSIALIHQLRNTYSEAIATLNKLHEAILTTDSLFQIGKMNRENYERQFELLNSLLTSNIAAIDTKEKEPSRIILLTSTDNEVNKLIETFTHATNEITAHNNLVANYSTEVNQLTNDIWNFMLNEQHSLINTFITQQTAFNNVIRTLKLKISDKKNEIGTVKASINEAESKITSIQPTVDEINRSLTAYGFENFKIVKSTLQENSYQIQRPDGTIVANTLSEGEETFISFLYFMQLAKGSTDESKVSDKKILVIDDPICSLDSTILYIVSAMIKDLSIKVKKEICDVEQLFILTHNVFFHKEASYIDGRTTEDKNVHFWIINKDCNISYITPFNTKNPITTSYELLWTELRNNTSASLISIQNTMRRIIENYFSLLGNKKDDYIINSFDNVEDQLICKSLLHWINDGSHSIPDDIFIDSYNDSVSKYKEVFKKIFYATHNGAHYNMMMKIDEPQENTT